MRHFLGLEFVVWIALAGPIAACGSDGPCPTDGAVKNREGICDCPPGTFYVADGNRCMQLETSASDSGDMDRPSTATDGGSRQDGASSMTSAVDATDLDSGFAARDSSPEAHQDASRGAEDGSFPRPDVLCGAGDCDSSLTGKPIDDAGGNGPADAGGGGPADAGSDRPAECTQLTWYCDADGDDFAANSVGKVTSCAKPAATDACADWTTRAPDGANTQDCDDGSALRFPGAGFGLSPASSGDLNCDGQTETKIEFVASKITTYSSTTQFNVCKEYVVGTTECECWQSTALGKGFRQLTSQGPDVDYSIPYVMPTFPCAESSGDVIFLTYRRCPGAGDSVVVRQLCR